MGPGEEILMAMATGMKIRGEKMRNVEETMMSKRRL